MEKPVCLQPALALLGCMHGATGSAEPRFEPGPGGDFEGVRVGLATGTPAGVGQVLLPTAWHNWVTCWQTSALVPENWPGLASGHAHLAVLLAQSMTCASPQGMVSLEER